LHGLEKVYRAPTRPDGRRIGSWNQLGLFLLHSLRSASLRLLLRALGATDQSLGDRSSISGSSSRHVVKVRVLIHTIGQRFDLHVDALLDVVVRQSQSQRGVQLS
jgi:hypothetical protein